MKLTLLLAIAAGACVGGSGPATPPPPRWAGLVAAAPPGRTCRVEKEKARAGAKLLAPALLTPASLLSPPVPGATAAASAMPNPASTYCASNPGGTSQILTAPDGGQTGFCAFGGADAAIEEWTLFRSSGPPTPPVAGVTAAPPQAAVAAFLGFLVVLHINF